MPEEPKKPDDQQKKNPKKQRKIFGRVSQVQKLEEIASMYTYSVVLVFSHDLSVEEIAAAVQTGLESEFDGVFDNNVKVQQAEQG